MPLRPGPGNLAVLPSTTQVVSGAVRAKDDPGTPYADHNARECRLRRGPDSDAPSLSADGRFVAFLSAATNLAPGDTNAKGDVFVHDRLEVVLMKDANDRVIGFEVLHYRPPSADAGLAIESIVPTGA